MKSRLLVLAILAAPVISTTAYSADSGADGGVPPSQCLSPGEPRRNFGPVAVEQFPNFDAAILEIGANCQANEHFYAVAVEGMCSDGRRLLNTGRGYTNSIRLYTSDGDFDSQIFQTDVQSAPCMGQFFWPQYRQCESPVVVKKFCGLFLEIGAPAFENRWPE